MEPMAISTDPPPPAAPLIGPPAPPAEQGLWWEVLEESTTAPEFIEKKVTPTEYTVESTHFIKLRLHNVSQTYTQTRVETPEFQYMGRTWRFLFFPRGNNNADGSISLYLDYVGPKEDTIWGLCLQFVLTAHSEDDSITQLASRESRHRFTMTESDWGFPSLIKRTYFTSEEPGKRFVVDNSIVVSVFAQVIKDEYGTLWHNFLNYDSKKMTGYVGLKNQGATCYMNSILQSLFFTNSFRKAVYQIPVGGEDDKDKAVTYALQKVFYQLQTSNEPVGTTELTKSFGWDVVESFMQHDVQEFNRVLCDNLENKMKGTSVEGTVAKLLEGKYKMYIRCINVDYESSRLEPFYDIQLNVKGLKTLEDSFKDYIQVETMDGDNKYMAEGYGLQDARKGVIFEKLPPVLHLQLKRFEYDFQRDCNVKINDRHEFPLTIDLRPYMTNPDEQPPQVYHLHGVLVHSGDSHGGHYCAFIRPEPYGGWFKFDDDRVTRCSAKEAMDDNFGVEPPDPNAPDARVEMTRSRLSRKYTNAYMLVYIRETELNEVLAPVTEADVPRALVERIEREREELLRQQRDREEDHLQMDVRIVTEETLRHNQGPDLFVRKFSDTPANGYSFRLRKTMLLSDLRKHIEATLQIPQLAQRFWSFAPRQNQSFRPDEPLVGHEDMTLESIRLQLKVKSVLFLFLERPQHPPAVLATLPPEKYFEPLTPDRHLLFVKYYEPALPPAEPKYTFVTYMYVKSSERPLDIVDRIVALLQLPARTPVKIYEEISAQQVDEVKPKKTFKDNEIGTGDIIVVQKELSPEQAKQFPQPTVKQYLEYLANRLVVKFRPRENPRDPKDVFELTLSVKMTYDEVAQRVGEAINWDPMKLRFLSHRVQPEGPFNEIRRTPGLTLEQMLVPATQYQGMTDTLYYEKLDMSILELENKLARQVVWMNAHRQEEGTYTLLVEKTDTVQALFDQLKGKVSLRGDSNKKLKTSSEPVSPAAPPVAAPPAGDRMDVSPQPAPHNGVPAKPGALARVAQDDNAMATSEDEHSPPAVVAAVPTAPMDEDLEDEQGTGQFRLYQVYNGKLGGLFDGSKPVTQLSTNDIFVAEEIPADQLHLDTKDRLVLVAHFHKDIYGFHSLPFYFRVKQNETAGQLKQRLRKALNLSEKEFGKYKLARIHRWEKIDYYADDAAPVIDADWTDKDVLGLDHIDRSNRGGRFGQFERAVVIKN